MKLDSMFFFDKLEGAIARNNSLLVVSLDPNPEMLPERYRQVTGGNQTTQDRITPDRTGLRDWLLWVIEQTQDQVCAYKPTLGFYEALGAAGLTLLETSAAGHSPRFPSFWMRSMAI
jgi:uridine monophosphate synthetase